MSYAVLLGKSSNKGKVLFEREGVDTNLMEIDPKHTANTSVI